MEYYEGLTLSAIKIFFLPTMSSNVNQPVDENLENHHVGILSSYNNRLLRLLRNEMKYVVKGAIFLNLRRKKKPFGISNNIGVLH